MHFITKLSILCLFALLSIKASAVEWGTYTHVKHVYVAHSGSVFITLDTLPGCYQEQGAYLAGSDNDKAYSTILAAFMAQKKVLPLYEIVKPDSTGWDKCQITSFFVTR